MLKSEWYTLITGILALIADVIALTTFLAGVWVPGSVNSNPGELPLLYQAILAITIIYGWFSISWVLVRRAFIARGYSRSGFSVASLKSILGVGVLVAPLILAWWATVSQGEAIRQQAEIDRKQEIRSTQTAQAILTPDNLTDSATVFSNPTGNHDKVDTSGYFCLATLSFPILGIGLYIVLLFLMPMVYSDMPEVSIVEVLESFATGEFKD